MKLEMVAHGFAFPFGVRFIQCDKTVEANFYVIPF